MRLAADLVLLPSIGTSTAGDGAQIVQQPHLNINEDMMLIRICIYYCAALLFKYYYTKTRIL